MEHLTNAQCQALLQRAHVAHVAVVTEDGPYVTPMSFVTVGNHLLVRTRPGLKVDAIRVNPNACVEISEYDENTGGWKSVVIRGPMLRVDDDETRQVFMSNLINKYSKAIGSLLNPSVGVSLGDEIVFAISLEDMTGRTSGSFFGPATKPGRM